MLNNVLFAHNLHKTHQITGLRWAWTDNMTWIYLSKKQLTDLSRFLIHTKWQTDKSPLFSVKFDPNAFLAIFNPWSRSALAAPPSEKKHPSIGWWGESALVTGLPLHSVGHLIGHKSHRLSWSPKTGDENMSTKFYKTNRRCWRDCTSSPCRHPFHYIIALLFKLQKVFMATGGISAQ